MTQTWDGYCMTRKKYVTCRKDQPQIYSGSTPLGNICGYAKYAYKDYFIFFLKGTLTWNWEKM